MWNDESVLILAVGVRYTKRGTEQKDKNGLPFEAERVHDTR